MINKQINNNNKFQCNKWVCMVGIHINNINNFQCNNYITLNNFLIPINIK